MTKTKRVAANIRRLWIASTFVVLAILLVPFFRYGWPLIDAAFTPGSYGVHLAHDRRLIVDALIRSHPALVHAYIVALIADLVAIVVAMFLNRNVALIVGGVFTFVVLPLASEALIWWPDKRQGLYVTFGAIGVGFLLCCAAAIAAVVWFVKKLFAGASRPARVASVGVVPVAVETPHAFDGLPPPRLGG